MSSSADGALSSESAVDSASAEDSDSPKDSDSGVVARLRAWRESIRRRPPADLIYRTAVTIVGFLVVVLGVVLLPFPGPGWVVIFLGLGILATEYEWSRRLLRYTRAKVTAWTHWLGRQPLAVRAVFGLALLAFAAGVVALFLWWSGVPTWVPSWVPLVHDLPQRS